MNEQEKTLKALSLTAAELHIQNHITLAAYNGLVPEFANVSEILIPKLADHFRDYFGGGTFSPGSVMPVMMKVGR
jgi:hypothetical protein